MEWLLWSALLLLVIGWPLLIVVISVMRRRALRAVGKGGNDDL